MFERLNIRLRYWQHCWRWREDKAAYYIGEKIRASYASGVGAMARFRHNTRGDIWLSRGGPRMAMKTLALAGEEQRYHAGITLLSTHRAEEGHERPRDDTWFIPVVAFSRHASYRHGWYACSHLSDE